MPPRGLGEIIITQPNILYFYVSGVDYTENIMNFNFVEARNNAIEFSADLIAIDSSDKNYIAEGNDVELRVGSALIHKCIIEKAEHMSNEESSISGLGKVESLLKSELVNSVYSESLCDYTSELGRPVYSGLTSGAHGSSYTSGSESTDIFQGQLSGISEVTLGTNEYLGHITARADHDNVLSFLDNVARNLSGVWWTSYGNLPYNTNYYNVGKVHGNKDVQKVFDISGDNQNVTETSKELDYDNYANYVTMLGYGDGINQKKSTVYHATDNFTRLAASCESDATTATVEDGSVLAASGTVWIGMEQCTYSASGNTLTIVRSVTNGTDSNNQDYLKAYAHSKGVAVYDAQYTSNSTDGASRIDDRGVRKKSFTVQQIIDQDALDLAAINELIDRWEIKERITVVPSEFYSNIQRLGVGDRVTVNDAEAGLSGDYEIVAQRIKYREGLETVEYELSTACSTMTQDSTRDSLTSDLSKTATNAKHNAQYMQGATTAFNTQSYENCDANNPLNIRVYIPPDLLTVNKAIIAYKIEDYRAYTASSDLDSSRTTSSTSEIGGSASCSLADTWYPAGGSQIFASSDGGYLVILKVITSEADSNYGYVRLRNTTTNETYPSDSGHIFYVGPNMSIDIAVLVTNNFTGQSAQIEVKSNVAGKNYEVGGNVQLIGGHTHNMSYAISGIDGSDAVIDIDVGPDGSELRPPNATNITETSSPFDITDWIASGITLGTGGWSNIQITPDKRCRIEANLFVKGFIESK